MFHSPQIKCKLPASAPTGYVINHAAAPNVSAEVNATDLLKGVECGSGYNGTAKLNLCDSKEGEVTLSGCDLVF